MFRKNKGNYEYGKIQLQYDSRIKGVKQMQIVEGDEETIASLLGATIAKLLDGGFDRELLEYAIDNGLKRNKKQEIHIKEIHLSDENAKEFEKLLDRLMKGEK